MKYSVCVGPVGTVCLLLIAPAYAFETQRFSEAEIVGEQTRERRFSIEDSFLPLDVFSFDIDKDTLDEATLEIGTSVSPNLQLESEYADSPTVQPTQLSEIDQPYTTIGESLEAQSVTVITNVRVNLFGVGVDIILDAIEPLPSTTTFTLGNALIVEIPNALLTNEFEQVNPTEGIARISVENLPGNRVRLAITGTEAAPMVAVRSEAQALVVSVTPESVPTESIIEETIRVLVTAEKTPEDSLNVPISLTVLPEQQIEDAQINSIRDVAANTPNFFTTVGDRAFNFYSIRGISNSNFLTRDSVGFYLDDVPIEYFHQLFPGELFDLERVEILRGPQNLLYGRNSVAGVVNIISRPPSESLEAQLAAEYGTYNQRRIQASISDTLIPETLGLRVSGAYSARDGFAENILLDESANDQADIAGRINLVWTPAEDWNISLNVLGAASQDGGVTYVDVNQDNPFEVEENEIGELDLSVSAQSLRVAYDGSDFRFTSITAHNFSDVGYRSDGDYTAADLYSFNSQVISNIWSQEFRFHSPEAAERLRWLVGAYFQNRTFTIDQQQVEYTPEGAALFGIPDIRFGETFAEYEQTTLAAFSQVDFRPIDPLTLTLGLRYEYSRDELERSERTETFDGTVTTSGEVEDSTNGDTLLPRFAINYRFIPNAAVYGSITRGYRPATLNYSIADPTLNNVRQEESWNYEIGLKSSWLNDRLFLTLAGFINEINDYQVLLPNEQGFFTDITNADVRVVGLEAELRAIPADGLELIAGFGYADAEYTDYTNPLTGEDFNGNQLTYAPEYTYNLAAQYRSPGGFFGRVELQGVGLYFFDDANTIEQAPFALVNARIGYEFENTGIYLFANNLFDTEYITVAFVPAGVVRGNFGDRRTVGVQVRTRF
ncbi:TonB-dependent receptor domain-containing protein [Thermocoleostomius sinensis]|uniref:TonB-dependent receptor n=1 Tax=Thermocoleostomius sinensis A174 TaxID=2016057 RepID=A0A9E8Z8M8_9CYAN|nr:TonB-dependent receptor [Thermocoleostomius sinensis]WAL58524.1 TonB-dependent receptor [Thermocoleostomius sinensis A174]